MPLRTMPWIQGEHGLTLLPARDAVFTGQMQGVEAMLAANELHVVTTAQKFPIGSLLYDPSIDAKYRYVEYGGTTKAGDLIQAEAPDAAHDDLDPTGTGTGAGTAKGSVLISTADAITLVASEYAGGFMKIENDTGEGYRYPIKDNDAAASNALFTLWDPGLAVAIDATSDVALIKSRYKEVIIHPTTQTAVPVGAGLGIGANGSFGWVQTRGPASMLTNGTLLIGRNVAPGKTTAGSVDTYPITLTEAAPNTYVPGDNPAIGHVMDVGPTTEQSLIFLTLE